MNKHDLDTDLKRVLVTTTPLQEDQILKRATERLRDVQNHVSTDRRVGTRRRPRTRVVALAAVVAFAVTGVAAAAGLVEIHSPFRHDAAKGVPALTDVNAPAMTAAERRLLEEALPAVESSRSQDLGPSLADMPPMSEGRVLIDDTENGRLTGISSRRGDVCLVYSLDGAPTGGTCVQEFERSGISLAETASTNVGHQLFGLARDNVESIEVETTDGALSPATVSNNAFVWNNDEPKAEPVTLLIRYEDGSSFEKAVASRADLATT